MSNEVHIRYQCWSPLFHDLLLKKGFKEGKTVDKGNPSEAKVFTLKDMTIKSNLRWMQLIRTTKDGDNKTEFSGASIHDRLLLTFIGLPKRKGKQNAVED